MGATTAGDAAARPSTSPRRPGRPRRSPRPPRARPLIVIGVLFALRGFVFADRLSDAHPDILTFWLPRFSFLGRSIAAGHVPLWNPFEMAGYRYAADPQGGWLYLLPMGLFSQLSPAVAMRAFIVANPLIAGLGLFCVPAHRAALTTRGHGGRAVARDADVDLGDRDLDAVRRRDGVDARGPRRRRRLPARRALVGPPRLDRDRRDRLVAGRHRPPEPRPRRVHRARRRPTSSAGAVADARSRHEAASRGRSWRRGACRTAVFLVALPAALARDRACRASTRSRRRAWPPATTASATRSAPSAGATRGSLQANGVWSAWPLAFGADTRARTPARRSCSACRSPCGRAAGACSSGRSAARWRSRGS